MTDDELLAEIAALLHRCDPVPDSVYACAEAAWPDDRWERLELIADPILVRATARSFRFQGKGIQLEVRLTRRPWGTCLNGRMAPSAEFEVCWPAGVRSGRPDGAGLFQLEDLPNVPLRIHIGSLVTPWFWT